MAYPPQPLPPRTVDQRPAAVMAAIAGLLLMALVSVFYAVAGLALMPGIVGRFRDSATAAEINPDSVDAAAAVLWATPITAAVLGLLAAALLVGLAIGIQRGVNGFRIATWVVCALGLIGGGLAAIAGFVQRLGSWSIDGSDVGLGRALVDAHPAWWLWTSAVLSILQAVGYVVVAVLLALPAANAYFRRTPQAPSPQPSLLPPPPPVDPTAWQRPGPPAATPAGP